MFWALSQDPYMDLYPPKVLSGRNSSYPHFTGEKMERDRGLLQVAQPVSGGSGVPTEVGKDPEFSFLYHQEYPHPMSPQPFSKDLLHCPMVDSCADSQIPWNGQDETGTVDHRQWMCSPSSSTSECKVRLSEFRGGERQSHTHLIHISFASRCTSDNKGPVISKIIIFDNTTVF